MTAIKIVIQRGPEYPDDNGTPGELTLYRNGAVKFMAYTLERPWKRNAKNVSCIPPGVYQAYHLPSPRFVQSLLELKDVPDRSEILIHAGNWVKNTQGCILVGTSAPKGIYAVYRSQVALRKLHNNIIPYFAPGTEGPVEVEIKPANF